MSKNQKRKYSKKTYPANQKFGNKESSKKPDFYGEHKNTIWTIIVLIVLTIFFIVNNTRDVPERGPYPPNYNEKNIPDEINYN